MKLLVSSLVHAFDGLFYHLHKVAAVPRDC